MILTPFGIILRQHKDSTAIALEQHLLPADQIVIASTDYAANLLDVSSPTQIITTNAPTQPDDPLASGLWNDAIEQGGLTWFVTWFPPNNVENWQERDLWQHNAFVHEIPFNNDRALLFNIRTPIIADQSGDWRFGPVELASYGLKLEQMGLHLTLAWSLASPTDQDL